MTRDDCRMILENIEIVKAFAQGARLEWAFHNWKGEFLGWRPARDNVILIRCLGSYRVVKPRIRLKTGPCFERLDV